MKVTFCTIPLFYLILYRCCPTMPPLQHPVRKRFPFHEWTPSIHYARFQMVALRLFPGRKLYDFELFYVCHGQLSVAMEEGVMVGKNVFHHQGSIALDDSVEVGTSIIVRLHLSKKQKTGDTLVTGASPVFVRLDLGASPLGIFSSHYVSQWLVSQPLVTTSPPSAKNRRWVH